MREATTSARTLGERYDEEYDPIASEKLCVDILRQRMDAWAAFVGIDDIYESRYEDGSGGLDAELRKSMDELLAALDAFATRCGISLTCYRSWPIRRRSRTGAMG